MPVIARDDGAVRELTLARPERLNALDDALLGELSAELERATRDGVRALLLRGDGARAFSAGYDLNALPSVTEGPLPDAILESTLARLDALPMPIVAFVNGHAFGGGLELAARCDVRIGVAGTKLGMPPCKLGIVYAPRGLARFWALMGPSGARRLFLSGEPITAVQAHRAGLLDEVHPDLEAAECAAQILVRIMAENAPLAIAGTRRIFAELERSLLSAIGGDVERLRRQAFASDDAREGRAAFLEKRAPRFTGK
jgi:enoyl-CoA hydratase/carnithine racemase